MKKLLILVCTLAIATGAFASQAKNPPKARFNGTVTSYDAASKVLTVKKGDKDTKFQIADASEVTQGGAKVDLAAIAAGQSAKVEYWMDGATKMVVKVQLSGTAAKK
jgi:phage baseplate assembly protein gpV